MAGKNYSVWDRYEEEKRRKKDMLSLGKGPIKEVPEEKVKSTGSFVKDRAKLLENKERAEEILAHGKGPLKEEPKEGVYAKGAAAFTNKDFKLPDIYYKKAYEDDEKPSGEIKRGKEAYKTREFSYDVHDDPLFLQYLEAAKRNGNAAMVDTIAKGAARTGGMAGSYAVAAGAERYNDYMRGVNNIIPELEEIAYGRFKDELSRDMGIYEMDEAERKEESRVNALLYKYQNEGVDVLSQDEIIDLYAAGYYIKGDKVYGKEGELSTKNKAREADAAAIEVLLKRYQEREGSSITEEEDYNLHGWGNMSEENRIALEKEGYWYDEKMGMITDGTQFYAWGDGTPLENVMKEYFKGYDVSYADKMLKENGYTYMDGVLYDSYGQKVMIDYDELWDEAILVFQSEGYDELTPLQKAVLDYYGNYDEGENLVYRGGMEYAGPEEA